MKKLTCAILTLLMLSTTALHSKPAQAGILIGGGVGNGIKIFGIFIAIGGAAGIFVNAGSGGCDSFWDGYNWVAGCPSTDPDPKAMLGHLGVLGVGGALILLDEKSNGSNAELVDSLKQRYPFVDCSEALNELASIIQNQALAHSGETSNIVISISENQVREALGLADLSEIQTDLIVSELR